MVGCRDAIQVGRLLRDLENSGVCSETKTVICNCICGCKSPATETDPLPTLCMICAEMNSLNSPDHGLPYVEPAVEKLEPLEPITNEQKDKALQDYVAKNGF
jgi:hypothetical protein